MLLNQFLSVSFIEKAGDFTDDVGNLQPGNRISCKTGGVNVARKNKIKPDVVLKNFWKTTRILRIYSMQRCFRENRC